MSRLAFALVVFALAACTPDDESYPILPASGGVHARTGTQGGEGGGGGGGGGTTSPDAGTGGGGTVGDAGVGDAGARDGGIHDGGTLLDGAPPDATALLPDSAPTQVP